MNKKILIASLFATLMLLVPMTSVAGLSDVEDDCECQDVNRYDLYRVKLLLVRIKVITNILLLRFGHIPEIAEKCSDILENLDLNKLQEPPIICAILESICNQIDYIYDVLDYLLTVYEDYEIIFFIIASLIPPLAWIGVIVYSLGVPFGCWELPTS